MAISRSAFSYKAKARDFSAIRQRMREITQTRVHYGCERVFVVLRREGWRDNHKRVHRIYEDEGLSLRHCRPRRSRSARRRQPLKMATAPNALCGMDFVSDALFDGRRFRSLTVVDHFTHECLDIVVDQSLKGDDVADVMTRLVAQRGKSAAIKMDNGSEFAGKVMDRWAYENGGGSWTSPGVAYSPITPWWKASTDACGRSVSTRVGSCHWPTHGAKSNSGDASITRSDRTGHWHGKPLRNSPENMGPKRIPGCQIRPNLY
ncbi:UNVERIFIED_ORG: putative transposase [Xanthomonas campestris]